MKEQNIIHTQTLHICSYDRRITYSYIHIFKYIDRRKRLRLVKPHGNLVFLLLLEIKFLALNDNTMCADSLIDFVNLVKLLKMW